MQLYLDTDKIQRACFSLPGLFEFYDLYTIFLPLFYEHREWFYPWCDIGSVYGAPGDCLWGGGRVGTGDNDAKEVKALMQDYNISSRLTFSNSLLKKEHLSDRKCNELCAQFEHGGTVKNGIIIYSDLLMDYIHKQYPEFYFVSSTTKVITEWDTLCSELSRKEFQYVVPDFRMNSNSKKLNTLNDECKKKVEFLCNECCWFNCTDRKACYENVSRKVLGEACADHKCISPDADEGYVFSKAMKNPGFISTEAIQHVYLPMGFTQFKIEGRSLGSALVLEFLLYYLTKPEYQLQVREKMYLNSSLDLF
jgi:hypothetical protein